MPHSSTRARHPGFACRAEIRVQCGGGTNHRIGLFDAILVKENHIAAAARSQRVSEASASHAGAAGSRGRELTQLREALDARVDRILLDNFSLDRCATP